MRKIYLYGLFLILLLSYANSETISYEGWIYNTKNFEFDGILYRALISNNGNQLILSSENTVSLNLNQCYVKDFKKFCYNISTYDLELEDYKAYVYIYYLQPEIEMTRDVENNIMEVGEEASFTVVLENIGDEDAQDVEFTEDFPDNVEITDVDNAQILGMSVYWKGDLDAGESRTIEYTIKSLGNIDQYIKANAKYFDGFEEKNIYSGQVRLYSTPVLTITMSTDKEDYQIDEDIDFTINIMNTGESDIDINELKIVIPENIEVEKKSSSLKETSQGYNWEGSLDKTKNRTFDFDLKAKNIGLSFIVVNGEYEYDNIDYDITNTKHGFLVHNEGVEITSSLDDVEYVNSNEVKRIYVRVKNQNSFSVIRNLDFKTTTELPGFENQTYGSLGTNATIFVLDTEIRIPDVESERAYKLRFNISYESEDGEIFSEILEKNLVVKPVQKLTITPSFSSTNVNEKTPIDITLRVNNPGAEAINSVYVYSDIPNDFTIKGTSSNYFSINASEEKQILSFSIIPSFVEQEITENLTFYVEYTQDNKEYKIESRTPLTVKPIIPDITVEKTVSDSSLHQGEIFSVTYSITNNDDIPIYDLDMILTQDQDFDILNVFDYSYNRLDPGETITFDQEELRAKKSGTYPIEPSILYYRDEKDRMFNKSSTSPSVTVEKSHIEGPCIFVVQEAPLQANVSQPILVKYKLENLGNQQVTIQGETVGEEAIFYDEVDFEDEGEHIISKKYYEYDYLGNIARAYSNESTINVINQYNNNQDIDENKEQEEVPVENIEEYQEPEPEKRSFFASIFSWFKSLFQKRG